MVLVVVLVQVQVPYLHLHPHPHVPQQSASQVEVVQRRVPRDLLSQPLHLHPLLLQLRLQLVVPQQALAEAQVGLELEEELV